MDEPHIVPVPPAQMIEESIVQVRGRRAMLDADLARLYDVPTKRLNEQVKRNPQRFPEDFMFQLTREEGAALRVSRSQIATMKTEEAENRGKNLKYAPYVFTEQGVAMLSSVLNSERAIAVNIAIMRIFVKVREVLDANAEFSRKVEEIDRRLNDHDGQFQFLFETMDAFNQPIEIPVRRIGFVKPE